MLHARQSWATVWKFMDECSMSMNMPSIPAILVMIAASLVVRNLKDITAQIWPARMRVRNGLESVSVDLDATTGAGAVLSSVAIEPILKIP